MSYSLRDFGSYTAGGRIVQVTEGEPYKVDFTRSAQFEVDPKGHFAIEHAYVQYFIPEARNDEAPVVLVHGGGMSGTCWETTPDGRPGWLHGLLQMGYEVHVVDAVERGRSGFAPGHWNGEPLLRSLEEAWGLFRIGPNGGFSDRQAFEGQRFPIAQFEAFARCFVPRWLTTTPLQVDALLAVLERSGPACVICHSQGGEITFDALKKDPTNITQVIAVEPSCTPADEDDLSGRNLCVVIGDFLDISAFWEKRRDTWHAMAGLANTTLIDTAAVSPGHSHMLMFDKGSNALLHDVMQQR